MAAWNTKFRISKRPCNILYIHWIAQLVSLTLIRWIVISPADIAVNLLNNWGQKVAGSTPVGNTRICSSKPPVSKTENTSFSNILEVHYPGSMGT